MPAGNHMAPAGVNVLSAYRLWRGSAVHVWPGLGVHRGVSGDPVIATAILDRLLHRHRIINDDDRRHAPEPMQAAIKNPQVARVTPIGRTG